MDILDLLADIGYALDTPGAYTRGLLAGKPGERVGGREMLTEWGLTDPNDPNAWEGADFAGFGADVLFDPLNLIGIPGISKLSKTLKGERAAQAVQQEAVKAMEAAGGSAGRMMADAGGPGLATGTELVPTAATQGMPIPLPLGGGSPEFDLLGGLPKALPEPPYAMVGGSKRRLHPDDPFVASGKFDTHVSPGPVMETVTTLPKGHPIPKFANADEAQKAIDTAEDAIAAKYGEDVLSEIPLLTPTGGFVDLPWSHAPLNRKELAGLRALHIARDKAITQADDVVYAELLRKAQATTGPASNEAIKAALKPIQRRAEMRRAMGEAVSEYDIHDMAMETYHTLAKDVWPHADGTWNMSDALEEVAHPGAWGISPKPVLNQVKQVLDVVLGRDAPAVSPMGDMDLLGLLGGAKQLPSPRNLDDAVKSTVGNIYDEGVDFGVPHKLDPANYATRKEFLNAYMPMLLREFPEELTPERMAALGSVMDTSGDAFKPGSPLMGLMRSFVRDIAQQEQSWVYPLERLADLDPGVGKGDFTWFETVVNNGAKRAGLPSFEFPRGSDFMGGHVGSGDMLVDNLTDINPKDQKKLAQGILESLEKFKLPYPKPSEGIGFKDVAEAARWKAERLANVKGWLEASVDPLEYAIKLWEQSKASKAVNKIQPLI